MKRLKTRVLIESAADATKAARALLACLRGIDPESYEVLLIEHESLAGVPADGRSRDDLLPRLEEAIGKALPAGYYLSYEKVRRTGTSGYVLRREGEEELDAEGVGDALTTPARAPRDVTRAIERNATGLPPVEKRRRPPMPAVWTLSAESHYASGEGKRRDFRASVDDLEKVLSGWLHANGPSNYRPWWPSAADLLAGERLVDDEFRGRFDAVCRDAFPYARRFTDYREAEEIFFFVVYHVWRDFRGAAKRGIEPSTVSRTLVESAVRRMRVTRRQWPSLAHDGPDPEAYAQAGKALGMPDPAIRRAFHEMLMKVHFATKMGAVFDGPVNKVHDADLRAPVANIDPDFALVGDLLAGVLSPSDALLLETRLKNDAHAFERLWPLIEAWESNWLYSPAQRVAGLVGGRLSKPWGSFSLSPRSLATVRDETLEGLWTAFVGRVGRVSQGVDAEETRLLSAMRKDWRAAIAYHATS